MISRIKSYFKRGKIAALKRGYQYLASIGGQNSDWILSGISEDADLHQNAFKLRSRSRDLWKENPYIRKFRSDLLTNVFGSEGISMQSKVTEERDRVVYSPDEKAFLEMLQRKHNERRKLMAEHGVTIRHRSFYEGNKATAKVVVGQPDVFANNLIERAWKRWRKAANCTVGKRHTYGQTREFRLIMAARDGGCFIRHHRKADNEFGYAIEIIPDEICDHNLNERLANGNEIKMGIEYSPLGAPVRYHFLKRQPGDWQWTTINGVGRSGREHDVVDARDIIHYCAFEDSTTGRGAPWISAIIPKARQLDRYEESEVISARAEACKGGHYEPQIGGLDAMELASIVEGNKGELTDEVSPGMWKPLPFGWIAKAHDPTHPNGNYPDFRKSILRAVAAGLPGSNYNTLSSDYESVNYSSYKAARIDVNEVYKSIQRFDIDVAERPIFEAWLEMALIKGAIPLPDTKFDKFNAPRFQGRRWEGLEPLKEANAAKANIGMMLTSRTRLTEERGQDFEEILEELAMEKVLIEAAGLDPDPELPPPEEDDEGEDPPTNGNGKLNGKSRLQLT